MVLIGLKPTRDMQIPSSHTKGTAKPRERPRLRRSVDKYSAKVGFTLIFDPLLLNSRHASNYDLDSSYNLPVSCVLFPNKRPYRAPPL